MNTLTTLKLEEPLNAKSVDDLFQTDSGKKAKGEFAFELAALVEAHAGTAHVPVQLASLFDWLWAGHLAGGAEAGDAWPLQDGAGDETGGDAEDGTNGQD